MRMRQINRKSFVLCDCDDKNQKVKNKIKEKKHKKQKKWRNKRRFLVSE